MTLLLALLLSVRPAAAQLEKLDARAQELIKRAREALPPEEFGEEAGEVSEEEARRPPLQVSETVWRSSRLDETGLEQLYSLGIKTIVNLEDEGHQREELDALARIEKRRAEEGKPAWHIESVDVHMSGISRPRFEKVDRALALLSDPSKGPVLVHCKHGEDRTGVVVAAYRVEVEKKLSLPQAVAEAKSFKCCHLVLIGENGLRDFLIGYGLHRR